MENIANNFNGFVDVVSEAIRTVMNTEIGQKMTEDLLRQTLEKNPNLTGSEWKKIKSEFMTFLFCQFVMETPDAMKELAEHTYNELNKEES